MQSSTSYQDETLSLQDTLHEASIQQVESIGKSDDDYNSSIESGIFTSLDSNGVLIFWTTKVIPNDSVIDIPGLSVWSNLMLIPIRKMNFMEGKIGSSNRYISTPVIAIVPGNSFSMYASTGGGEVSCFHRLGHGSHTSRQPLKRYRNSENNDPPSEVTCISVSISHSVCKATGLSALLDSDYLVLLGRCDGSIDLFIDKETGAHCIHSWDTTTFKTKSQVSRDLKTKGSYLTNSIVAVYWCPHRPAVFIAVSTDGTVFCFDLLVDLYSPVTSSTLPMYTNTSSSEKSSKLVVELLPLESKGNRRRLMLLVGFENKFHMHTVQARELSYHWIRPCITNDELLQDKNALRCQLTKLII